MIACKNCVCLVGLRSVKYRWIAGSWIYSKPVGWLVCLLVSVVWSDLWSVVGLPAGLFAIHSVGWLSHPAGLPISNLSPFDQPTIHPSIWSLTNRPKTVLLSALASNQCLNFRNLGFDVSPFLLGWLAAVGLPDLCSQVAGQVWSVFHLASQGGRPSLLDRLSSDRSGNAQKGVCDLLCHAMYI